MLSRTIDTPQGRVAFLESSGSGTPVVFIHGNSTCRDVFRYQFETALATTQHIIAIDLPGHGQSDDALDPRQAYTIPGYAATLIEALRSLNVTRAALVGWSLGGHISLEMIGQGFEAVGAMIVGAPPVKPGILGMFRGFQPQLDLLLATKRTLNARDISRFARVCVGEKHAAQLHDTIARTDRRARQILGRGLRAGLGVDQRWIVENLPTPIAVVNGSEEPFARLDYVAGISYESLWDQRCHIIDGVGHAPFLEAPERFNPLLFRFLNDIDFSRTDNTTQQRIRSVA
ncbi:alpha/beta hydrolase fold protein [Nitrobacter sp. Nb-311A]|uniref:alpha/beta fold hydrolase n=1 Tax=unclassified Nitrobacter TaxID=2620411 RepID=UPI0000686425|nr:MULTISPECIES: alpha/beta hydrolase [unclassified Nitrobacter]EAQ37441.1 alpha/beta hydrolase fold protein [Nitrobacter sp. Nb-311A]MCB1392275.1 alpha/beta hydrolase [Nitrobacter sp.]MCV0385228.1 alpha/beta hydrolase [Nitrobacter sp.]